MSIFTNFEISCQADMLLKKVDEADALELERIKVKAELMKAHALAEQADEMKRQADATNKNAEAIESLKNVIYRTKFIA